MGFKIEQWTRAEIGTLALLVLSLWGVYLKTLSPAFPANDSPETISSAFELGIQHPPGYPLHALLGRVAIRAIPLGSPAWRMNCLSAFLGVLCASLAAWLCRIFAKDSKAWALSFLATGMWRVAWEEATEAKGGIYLLNLALCLGLLAAYKRDTRIFALLAGLALANHYMSALIFILPCAALIVWRAPREGRKFLWVLPGLSLYLYLPLRAVGEPFNNIGDPSSLKGFLWVVLRRGYSQAGLTQDWGVAADQARLWAMHSFSFGAYWVAPLGLLGLWKLFKRKRADAVLLLSIYAMIFVSVVLLNRTLADVRFLADIFILPGQALLALASGIGLDFGGWGVSALLGLILAWVNFAPLNRSGDLVAYDYGRNVLASLPRDAVYAADGDYHFMPLVYSQQLEGRRKDAELLVSSLTADPAYQARLFKRRGIRIAGRNPEEALLSLARQRPLSLSSFHPSIREEVLGGARFWQHGLYVQAASAGGPELRYAPAWVIRDDPRAGGEPLQNALWPWYAVSLVTIGNQLDSVQRWGEAAQAYHRAMGIPGDKPRSHILYNLGRALEGLGRPLEASAAYERSLVFEPGLEPSRQRLAAISLNSAALLKR